MTFANVKLIVAREIRDQLRDRRTLFVIVVLPILVYPLLGMSFLQVSQFLQQQSLRVLVMGAADLHDLPPLLENNQFAESLFTDPKQAKLLEVDTSEKPQPAQTKDSDPRAEARQKVASGKYDVILYFPADFRQQLQSLREAVRRQKNRFRRYEAREHGIARVAKDQPRSISRRESCRVTLSAGALPGNLLHHGQ
jgi:sodium transport system permease protein